MIANTITLFMLMPWAVLCWASAARMHAGQTGRLYRMQVEGAMIALLATLSRGIIYGPLTGINRTGTQHWEEWYNRGEWGLFYIGTLLFLLGYALERRPRRGLAPWPKPWMRAAWLGLVAGAAIGLAAWYYGWSMMEDLPWQFGRIAFSCGWFPFVWGYARHDRNAHHLTEAE